MKTVSPSANITSMSSCRGLSRAIRTWRLSRLPSDSGKWEILLCDKFSFSSFFKLLRLLGILDI